jgi:hypothetical protein
MSGLWGWLTSRGKANCKPVRDVEVDCESPASREAPPRNTKEAVKRATHRWNEQGDRADQDYYHVPGGGNRAGEAKAANEAAVKAKGPKPKAERPGAVDAKR